MYIAMNRFTVAPDQAGEFVERWKNRDSYLDEVPGFIAFKLLHDGDGIIISHSTWDNKESFVAWTESEAFRKAHAQGSMKDLLKGPPQFSGYDVVLEQDAQ